MKMIVAALQNRDIPINGSGEQLRTFCWVEDVVDGLVRLMDAPPTETARTINFGSSHEVSIRALAEKIVAKEQSAETQQTGAQRMKQAIKEAPYVLVIKWNNPIMGEMEYPFKSYAEAEKNFEVAKREVGNHHATEAHMYKQSEGQRIPVMGILSGKL